MKIEKVRCCPICESFHMSDWVERAIPKSSPKSSIKFQMQQCGTCHSWHMASPPDADALKAYYAGDYYFFNRDDDFEFSRNH